MTTARDLITKSLQKIGALVKNEQPSSDEANDALYALNALLGSYANDSMLVYARTWETFNISGGDGEYTMGVGGDFNTSRPLLVIASYVKDSGTDYNLSIISDEMYNKQIAQKDTAGIPKYLNTDNGSPLVKVRLYPVPNKSYQIFLLTEKPVTNVSLDDTIVFPAGWERMIIYNLAVDLAPEYGMPLDQVIYKTAEDSKRLVRANIMRNRTMDSNPLVIRSGRFENGWM